MKRRAFILAALLVLVGSAVAVAGIPSADGTIHGCRKNSNGTLRVIDAEAGQQCQAGETALTWNQTGPQGPVGQQGPPGPAGADGVSGLQIVTNSVQVAGGGQLTDITVQCPTGKVAIAGGFAMNDANTTVNASLPQQAVNNPGWVIEVRNNNAFQVPATVQAICSTAT